MTNDAALAPLIESYLDLRWQFDPVQATAAGRMEHDHRLGRFGGQEIKEYVAALRALANAVEELPLEELDDELDRTALLNEIRVSVHRFERERPHVRNPEYWLSHILQGLYLLLVRGDRSAPHRAISAARRLRDVPGLLDQARDTLQDCPAVFTETSLSVIEGGQALIREIAEHLRPADDEGFDDVIDDARAALASFGRHLPQVSIPPETGGFAIGEDALDFRLHFEHALGASAKTIGRYGEQLIEEVEHELTKLATQIDGTPRWSATAERLRAEHPTDCFAEQYADEMERARQFVEERGLTPTYPGELKVVPTPSFLRPLIPIAAYEPPGMFSEDRTGLFYVSPPPANSDGTDGGHQAGRQCEYEIAPRALHEGYPGHHLQFLAAQAQPRVVRKLMDTPLTYEGWALYCEDMMGEEGFYRAPEERLFQLIALLLRGIRVVLDVGLHTGTMTYDEAVRLLVDRAMLDRATAESEVRRYCATPAYPLCYAVGRREIKDLRDDFRAAAGGEYSLRAFHDAVLSYGGLPVGLMRWGMGLRRS